MKFELVEFYTADKNRGRMPKEVIGTVHIYAIDCQLDIRGIHVCQRGKSLFFRFPHFKTIDNETGKPVMYPHVRWQDESVQKSMINFLHEEVKPVIREKLNPKSK